MDVCACCPSACRTPYSFSVVSTNTRRTRRDTNVDIFCSAGLGLRPDRRHSLASHNMKNVVICFNLDARHSLGYAERIKCETMSTGRRCCCRFIIFIFIFGWLNYNSNLFCCAQYGVGLASLIGGIRSFEFG